MKRNVFLIGLNHFNLQKLRTIRNAENYNFHGIIEPVKSDAPNFSFARSA